MAVAVVLLVLLLRTPLPQIGDTIEFGGLYWLVLDVQERQTLIISQDVVDQRAFHNLWEQTGWHDSHIREWLNSDFYNGFTARERARIIETRNANTANPWSGSFWSLLDTYDKIFLLSLEELVYYFGDSGNLTGINRQTAPFWGFDDEYNQARIAADAAGRPSSWWLRSPGSTQDFNAAVVSEIGNVYMTGYPIVYPGGGVRPVLWLNWR